MIHRFVRSRLVPLLLLLAAGCQGAGELFQPAPTDPLDGYRGSLAEAGINTELDWGPKQNLLLAEFKTLKEAHARLQQRVDQLVAENQNLKTRLDDEGAVVQQEKARAAQAEAETELLRQRRRELEARILGLSIEKTRLEQANLLGKIEALQRELDQAPPAIEEAAATPPRGR